MIIFKLLPTNILNWIGTCRTLLDLLVFKLWSCSENIQGLFFNVPSQLNNWPFLKSVNIRTHILVSLRPINMITLRQKNEITLAWFYYQQYVCNISHQMFDHQLWTWLISFNRSWQLPDSSTQIGWLNFDGSIYLAEKFQYQRIDGSKGGPIRSNYFDLNNRR